MVTNWLRHEGKDRARNEPQIPGWHSTDWATWEAGRLLAGMTVVRGQA